MILNPYGVDCSGLTNGGRIVPARESHSFVMGLDLGQQLDPSAIAVVERIVVPVTATITTRPVYHVRHVERIGLGTTYPAIVDYVRKLLARDPLNGRAALVIDHTGVGRPVFDMFRAARLPAIGITITSGENWTHNPDGSGFHVAKLLLVSRLQALLHAGDLKIAKNLSETPALVQELQDFQANISEAGNASFGARVGAHDDLVLATAIAVWFLARGMETKTIIKDLEI